MYKVQFANNYVYSQYKITNKFIKVLRNKVY